MDDSDSISAQRQLDLVRFLDILGGIAIGHIFVNF